MRDFLQFNFYDIFGITGAFIVLFFFILNKFNYLSHKSNYYNWGNFIGSCLLIYFAWKTKSLPFIILNTVWAFVSLKDIILNLIKKFKK